MPLPYSRVLAGVLAAIGAYYTHKTFALNRAGQITERFTRAVEQLGSTTLDIRLGRIYALERIARDSRHDHPQVIEVLTAYVREHASWSPERPQPAVSQPSCYDSGAHLRMVRRPTNRRVMSIAAPKGLQVMLFVFPP